jgi:anti-anti-sigma factor
MGRILHTTVEATHVLKLTGEVKVSQSPALSRFIENLAEFDILKSFVIDLTEARSIDSTALGFLAKIAIHTQNRFQFKPTIVCCSDDINRVMESMGFAQIFVLSGQPINAIDNMSELASDPLQEDDLRLQVLDAHRTLMALNHSNFMEFRDLVEALEEELPQPQVPGKQFAR